MLFSDILGEYIPDYRCILIQLKDYSNEELKKKKNELSLIMMFDKLQGTGDYEELAKELDGGYLEELLQGTPEYLLTLMVQIIRMFLAKLNVPWDEVETFTEQVKERKMGEFFKHFQGWDVQAIRKETREEDINKFLRTIKKYHATEENAVKDLMEEYGFSREMAEERVALFW